MTLLQNRTLALAVLAGLAMAGGVIAQSGAPTPAQQQELDAARAERDGAAERYADLARRYRGKDAPVRVEQRMLRTPVLGVLLAPDDGTGVRIAGVTPEGGAAKAGLRSGDRLTTIDDKAIAGVDGEARLDNARTLLRDLEIDRPVSVGYSRDGRSAMASVTPELDERVFMFNDSDGSLAKLGGPVVIRRGKQGELDFEADSFEIDTEAMREGMGEAMRTMSREMPRISKEIVRLGDCGKQGDCRLPMLSEAFRWSGLNLASLDAQLGRYFGADEGVLVLSTGEELAELQAGDVLQKIDGKPVGSPREAMAALRAKPADSSVRVDYLRDRKAQTAQVKVPKAMLFRFPVPPAPPAPPAAPPPPPAAGMPVPAPPVAPPAPDAPRAITRRKIVTVDADGNRHQREDDGTAPLPPGARRIEQRRMVFVDDNGKTTVLEGDDAPAPPAPPAPPAQPRTPAAPPAPPPPAGD